tara:strand:- start:461 stop:574 length:114 start_codon:yes stop_codon:yes gene_type:complete
MNNPEVSATSFIAFKYEVYFEKSRDIFHTESGIVNES